MSCPASHGWFDLNQAADFVAITRQKKPFATLHAHTSSAPCLGASWGAETISTSEILSPKFAAQKQENKSGDYKSNSLVQGNFMKRSGMTFRKKIRMRTSFNTTLTNCIEASLINEVYDKIQLKRGLTQEGSGPSKAWNNRGFLYWSYRLSDAAKRANWYHWIHWSVPGFFDILIGCLDIKLK